MKAFTTKVTNSEINNLLTGMNKAADIIISTMGGAGKNIVISGYNAITDESGSLNFTKDGISVAKNIKFANEEENIGATLLINAANKTVEQCGDGTTTTVLFVKTLVNELLKYKNDIGIDTILTELDKFTEEYTKLLNERKTSVETIDDIYHIARTSSKSTKIAMLMKEIYNQTGFAAAISLELSRTSDETYYQIINGLSFNSPMINPRFANQENGTCVFENAVIIIEENPISSKNGGELEEIMDKALGNDQSIVIIAPQFPERFVKTVVNNVVRTGLKVCLIESPGYGSAISHNYADIRAFIGDDYVDKIVITDHDFTIFNTPIEQSLAKRVKKLRTMAANAIEEYDENDYLNRIQRLNQSGAIIYVGGVTMKNAKEEYDRIEDSIGAVRAAIEGGYVRGAGSQNALLLPHVSEYKIKDALETVLMSQITQIMSNANLSDRTIKYDIPFNVRSRQYDDNIIDPTNVLISAMTNAIALTKLLLNTSYIIHND